MNDPQKRTAFMTVILLLIFYTIVFMPIIHAGFYADDALNTLIKGVIELSTNSSTSNPWNLSQTISSGWVHNNGRIYPLYFFTTYPFYYLFYNPISAQIARCAFIALSLIGTAWFIQLLTKNIKNALLFLFIMPALWSIRTCFDPLSTFGIYLFLMMLFFSLTLAFFIKFIESKNLFWSVLSLLSSIWVLLTYEVGVSILLAVAALAWLKKKSLKQFVLWTTPYLIITLIYLVACFTTRHYSAGIYPGIAFGHFDYYFLRTFFSQLISPLPLTFGILSGHYLKVSVFKSFFQDPINIILIIMLFTISFKAIRKLLPSISFSKPTAYCLIAIGLALNLVPSFLMAISARYQLSISWGECYLPVYLQYFGTAFIFLSLFNLMNIRIQSDEKKRKLHTRYAIAISLITCIALIFNSYSVKIENDGWKSPRDLMVNAMEHGLLAGMRPNNAIVNIQGPWNTSAFYMQHGNIKLNVVNLQDPKQLAHGKTPNNMQFITIFDQFPDYTLNYIILGNLKHSANNSSTLYNPTLFTLPNQGIQKAAMTEPMFFSMSQHIRYSDDGYVIIGKMTAIHYQQENKATVVTAITIANPKLFLNISNEENKADVLTLLKTNSIPIPANFKIAQKATLINLPNGQYTLQNALSTGP